MAARTAAALAIDTTVVTLKSQLQTYIGLQQATSGDAPQVMFLQWFIQQLLSVPGMEQAVRTSNYFDQAAWGKTLSQLDPYA